MNQGVFVPLMLMFPEANIPVISMSLQTQLDAAYHVKLGEALAPLRQEGVLIIGSGASFHNFDYFFTRNSKHKAEGVRHSSVWDTWLTAAVCDTNVAPADRISTLVDWKTNPSGVASHPPRGEEHFLPFHVMLGAALGTPGICSAKFGVAGQDLISSCFLWN